MKKYIAKYLISLILCIAIGTAVFFVLDNILSGDQNRRVTLMNRVVAEISDSDTDDIESLVRDIESSSRSEWISEFGKVNVPAEMIYVDGKEEYSGVTKAADIDRGAVWTIASDGEVKGFLIFDFDNADRTKILITAEAAVVLCYILIVIYFIYIDRKVMIPFNRLADYPERIAKNETADHIPESRGKYFGKYIWGMNMLRDRLTGDNNKLRKLEKEKQTLISTIAHGIKTPVANIRLYSEAIKSGLYRADGNPDPADSEVADKILKNADDINVLVKELLENASKGIVIFEPSVDAFYLSEIEDFLTREYTNRLNVLKIPFKIDCKSRIMIRSDKSGIIRIISQLLENAIKYGDGNGITVTIDKNDDGYFFSVRNTGSPIPEGEATYIFNSFWRGSNASETEGNGLGLYEASFIARKLGGDIAYRFREESGESEFEVFLPL